MSKNSSDILIFVLDLDELYSLLTYYKIFKF